METFLFRKLVELVHRTMKKKKKKKKKILKMQLNMDYSYPNP